VIESFLEPDTLIPLHAHSNEEIISWVPAGIMRHKDLTVGELRVDSGHLMIMNAGRGFWHEEQTNKTDPALRMLQIFVRPHALNLEPKVQFGAMEVAEPNRWRHLIGPAGTNAPFYVRNDVDIYDVHLDEGSSLRIPNLPGRDAYLYVFTGELEVAETAVAETETLLVTQIGNSETLTVHAKKPSLIVLFLVNPHAPITKEGTVGR
jgi:redox-sensitive bicupin YhaK (pirin superfamily)